jgi:hypothetical protein
VTTDDVIASDVVACDDAIACTHIITPERQEEFSQNLVLTLYHWRLLQTCCVLYPAVTNTNVTDAESREWEDIS